MWLLASPCLNGSGFFETWQTMYFYNIILSNGAVHDFANEDNVSTDHPAFDDAQQAATERIDQLLAVKGQRTVNDFHRELGLILWDHCGMARNAEGLIDAKKKVRQIRDEFWQNVTVAGTAGEFNQVVERAGRVADFMEFAELMIHDAYERNESCGGHFREEHQTEEGEARRNDDDFTYDCEQVG